jgi:hypothetical protein
VNAVLYPSYSASLLSATNLFNLRPKKRCLCSIPLGYLLSGTDQSQKSESLFDIEADSSFNNTSTGSEAVEGQVGALNDLKPSHSDIYDSIGELLISAQTVFE